METVLIDSTTVESVPMDAVIDAVKDAFAAYERGSVQMPAKTYVDLPQ